MKNIVCGKCGGYIGASSYTGGAKKCECYTQEKKCEVTTADNDEMMIVQAPPFHEPAQAVSQSPIEKKCEIDCGALCRDLCDCPCHTPTAPEWEKEFEKLELCDCEHDDGEFQSERIKNFIKSLLQAEREKVLRDLYKEAKSAEGFNSGLGTYDVEQYAKSIGVDL